MPSAVRLRQHGFTLIELVIVLLLLGLIAGVATPRLFSMLTPDPARQLPTQLADKIDRLRSDAIFLGAMQTAVVNFTDNRLDTTREKWALPTDWAFEADDDATTDDDGNDKPLVLHFMPDGSASAAAFKLTGPNHLGWHYTIAPTTGRLHEGPL